MITLCRLNEITTSYQSLNEMITLCPLNEITTWKVEDMPDSHPQLATEETRAEDHFCSTVTRSEDGRYVVKLPKKEPAPPLGESKVSALRRYYSNKRTLQKNGTWSEFNGVVQEYLELGHAEVVPQPELQVNSAASYYLPMHGVIKDSTTTKLRVVFDASAKSKTSYSLNDQLLPGPCSYPHVTSVLNKFRQHRVGLSADISKMFREVVLHPSERDYHRFLVQDKDTSQVKVCRMLHLTFGVTSSPFLATSVI